MDKLMITDKAGQFIAEIEAHNRHLAEGLRHEHAEDVLKNALIAGLAALAQEGPWPLAYLEVVAGFMADMKTTLERGPVA